MIVDDEPLAHDVIKHHLTNRIDVELVQQSYQAIDALAWLANNSVDLLFLDINMPKLSGIEMLKVMANPPHVVITSAYKEFAFDGFELNVVDYLLKPINAERLNRAIDKVHQRLSSPQTTANQDVFFKVDRSLKKYHINNITFLEAYGNYVKIWQNTKVELVNSTLKNMLEQLPQNEFTQVHKSYVVRNANISAFHTHELTLDGQHKIKIGNAYKKQVELLRSASSG